MADHDRDLDVLPRRPFVLLPPEQGGFEAALARGRRRRRRTAGSSVLASVVAVVLAVTLSAPSPDGAARLEFTPAAPGDLTTDTSRPGTADIKAEPLTLDTPAQPAEVRRGPSSRLDSEPAAPRPAAAPVAARPAQRRSTPDGRRRLEPPTEYRAPGGYANCVTSGFRVADRWCLQARYYPDSRSDNDKPDSRVALEVCRSFDTADGKLTYPTTQPVDFKILEGEVVVWQWSHNAVFDPVRNTDAVSPGDCLGYEVPWGDLDNSTPQSIVVPGDYLLRATGLAGELGSANNAEISITVYE